MLMPCSETSCASLWFSSGQEVGHWRSYCPMAASMSSINASRRLWSITSKHRSAGSPFIDSTTGVSTHRNHFVTTLVDPKRYPKAKLAHLYQLRWQATEVNFKHLKTTLKMEMILPKPGNGAERNLDAFACVQLAAKLDVASAQQSQVLLADVLARSSTTVQSVQTGLAQTTAQNRRCLYSTLLHVISDQLVLRPHRAEPRVTKEDPRVFPECSNLAPSSKLAGRLI